jgi:hypothetical protein
MNVGDAQELALFRTIKRDLRRKRFGLIPECCSVHHHRAYFSRDRNADIIFDVSIGISLQGASAPFFIWVWESKDYSSALSVDNVEEFHAKLQQIGADRTKGTVVVSGTMQKSALEYSASKGIGVAKSLPADRIVWLQFTRGGDLEEEAVAEANERALFEGATLRSITDPGYVSVNRGFYAYGEDGAPFDGPFEDLLQAGFVAVLKKPIWRLDAPRG